MQYGSPHQIYNSPAALFVAGFTGSPAMNLVPCTLHGQSVDLGGVAFEVPQTLAQRAAGTSALTFGIRPEDLSLTPGAGPSGATVSVPATVVLLEPLGAETLVTFKLGQNECVARCAASFEASPGTVLPVYMPHARMHLFNSATGNAI